MKSQLRQEAILRSLRRNGSSTIEALATEVGASRRTILRDLSSLRDEGHVIHSEPGRGGGLQLDPRSLQTTARLTVPEVFALIIGVATLRATQSLPFSDLADSGLAKIEKALPGDKMQDLRNFLSRIHIGQMPPLQDISGIGKTDPELLTAFEAGFLRRLLLRFDYRDAKGQETSRQVEPQAILILPPVWYLVAWDPMRSDFRRFRMDRISAPEAIEGTWFRPRHVPFEEDVCPFQMQR